MSSFSADWLTLREPLDAASRPVDLGRIISQQLRQKPVQQEVVHVVDLGSGTGSNLRFAAPLIGGSQEWLLLDQDPLLLNAVNSRMRSWALAAPAQIEESGGLLTMRGAGFECGLRTARTDLATDLEQIDFPDGALVTASALLDLVSEEWLAALARMCTNADALIWFALTWDGHIRWSPEEPEDEEIRDLVRIHQRTDKGFGPALGPLGAQRAAGIFGANGYRTHSASSDWRLGADEIAMQKALLEGWVEAAIEIAPQKAADLRQWRDRRDVHIARGQSELIVGHTDIIGWPDRGTVESFQ